MRPIACRISWHDFRRLQQLCKEFRISTSEFLRKAICLEMERLLNLSDEERINEIDDNVDWNRSKYLMNCKSK